MDKNEPLDQDAVTMAKAIRQSESGGNFSARGKAGEMGGYQFMPTTWAATAPKYGINVPLEQATPKQQNEVAYRQIKQWKDEGHNVGEIASMWNAGVGEPKAYTGTFSNGQPSVRAGKFDVPAYAKSVATAYHALKGGGQVMPDINNPSNPNTPTGGQQGAAPQESMGHRILHGIVNPIATTIARPFQAGAELMGASAEDVDKFSKEKLGGFVDPVPQDAKGVLKDVGNAAQTVATGYIGAKVMGGLLGPAKVLTSPSVETAMARFNMPMKEFLSLNKVEKLNALGEALASDGVGLGDAGEIAKAIKYLQPGPSFVKGLLSKGWSLGKAAILTKFLGDTVGGMIHGATGK